jgi:hypothetical protein
MTDAIEWTPVVVRLGELSHWAENPVTLTKAQARKLLKSTEKLGRMQTLAIGPTNGDGKHPLYDGHQRVNVWGGAFGMDLQVNALQSSRPLTDDERHAVPVMLRTAVGSLDWDVLSSWPAGDLTQWGMDDDLLTGWKRDIASLGDLLESETPEPQDAEPQIDRAEELQEKWQVKTGQTWKLGDHSLYCGPASEAKIKCNLAIFDPPFDWGTDQQQTAMSWAIWGTGILMGLEKCMPLAARGDFWHWWVWDAGMNRFGGRGNNPVTGCCMVLSFGQHHWYESQGLSILDANSIEHFEWPTQVVKIQDHLAGREYKHQKPSVLTDYIVALYSGTNDVVGDLFAGSGSFLISSQNLGRKYCGAEILPENCAVILNRWSRAFPDMPPSLA